MINKPPGLVTHPAPGNWRDTLMNGLLFANPKSARLPRAGIVHRLDRDTSGVLVCAQSERAFVALVRATGRPDHAPPVPGDRVRTAPDRRPRHGRRADRTRSAQSPADGGGAATAGQARADRLPGARERQRRTAPQAPRGAGLPAAHRAHPPDPRPPGQHRPSAGGRPHLRRRGLGGLRTPGACTPGGFPCGTRRAARRSRWTARFRSTSALAERLGLEFASRAPRRRRQADRGSRSASKSGQEPADG